MSQVINDDYCDQNENNCLKDVSFYIKGEKKQFV